MKQKMKAKRNRHDFFNAGLRKINAGQGNASQNKKIATN